MYADSDDSRKSRIVEVCIDATDILPNALWFMEEELEIQVEITDVKDRSGMPLMGIIS